ncbi:MAG: ArgE/DapE family deacylase [Gemmatimonadota bacterium]|nr:ArgE/DapE family deacylase [Gemmatimonadota bacterium]
MTSISRGDALALTRALVAIDSRNPTLVPGGPGERAAAVRLSEVLADWGFQVDLLEALPGRPNVVARIGGGRGGRSLLLNGHLDTVGVEGMTHAPFDPAIRDGRLYGRGSSDMKGGIAAMCAAACRAAEDGLGGEVIIAAVIDEEFESHGTRHLVASGVTAHAAIVTEPTRLAIAPAHRGFAWLDVTVTGRAAHGSRYDLGVDAITGMAHLLAGLDEYHRDTLVPRTHPLLGHASLHAGVIAGGSGISTYPDHCTVSLERRTLPGEQGAAFAREVEAAIARVRKRFPNFAATITRGLTQEPNDVPADHPIVVALARALEAEGAPAPVEGLSCWTDAALLSAAGIPAVCFGPGDIALAHAAEEYVPVDEVARATSVLTEVIRAWSGPEGTAWGS